MKRGLATTFIIGAVFVVIRTSSAFPSERPVIVNAPSERSAVFPRPTLGDIQLIKTVASVGAPQFVSFPKGANVGAFVASKCGQPSAGMLIHPAYEKILLSRNKLLKRSDLATLPKAMMVEIPACAAFAPQAGTVPVSGESIQTIAEARSIPFNRTAFAKAVTDPHYGDALKTEYASAKSQYRDALQTENASIVPNTFTDVFQNVVGQFCYHAMKIEFGDQSYLSCANAAEIAAANPQIMNPKRIPHEIAVPVVAKPILNETAGTDTIPLKVSYQENLSNFDYPTEAGIKFVTELSSPAQYGPACAAAAVHAQGNWPFDVAEFEHALNLSDLGGKYAQSHPGRVLVVDTGFDFSEGKSRDPAVAKAFPTSYFHKLPIEDDPPGQTEDINHDGVVANGGWVGVNLASIHGSPSAETSVAYDHRSHGLAVTTLALGGRGIEDLRQRVQLPIQVGEASLVQLNTKNSPPLTSDDIEKSVTFAKAQGNEFDVINFSLSSPERIPTLDRLVADPDKRLVIVVAAGNDGRRLDAKNGVWPAALGGFATATDIQTSAFITVGAHDGDDKYVNFSNYGAGVDLLAPGCAVPSYDLEVDADQNAIGIKDQTVTGTSIAAPLVSFVAGLLVSSPTFQQKPQLVKIRIQASTDYDYDLQDKAASSGVLDVAKAIGFKYDILEVSNSASSPNADEHTSARANSQLRFGNVSFNADTFKCGFDLPISFTSIKKIARDNKPKDPVLVLSTEDSTKPARLNVHFCPPNSLDNLEYVFDDAETKERRTYKASDVLDFVARQ